MQRAHCARDLFIIVGREIDREAGLDGRSDQAPILDGDRIVEDGFVGEGDSVLADVGGDELFEERTVDFGPVSREIACLGIALQAARPERRDFLPSCHLTF
jgi:hypothetical protein